MSTTPTPETTAPQAPPARKAIPPRVLLISGLLAAAVIGCAGYLATRNMAAPADLTAAPVTTTPSVTTATPATSVPTTATASAGSTPQSTKPTAITTSAATTNATANDPDRVRDPFAPTEDGNGTGSTNGTTVSTPTTRPVPTATAQTLPVQSASATLPVTRSAPEQAPPAQVTTLPTQRQAPTPVILPITPAAVLPPSAPAVTLTPSTPQTSTTVTAPVRTLPVPVIPVAPPVTVVTIPTPAATTTTAPTTTTSPQTQVPVQTPQPTAPALNVAQQWLRDNQVTYGGRADSGETTTVILNTKDGQVFADVGKPIPGTDVTLTRVANQNLVFTVKGKTGQILIPASPETDTGAQP